MPSCPWLLTAILITTCSTWASAKNWNLLLSFTRSQIRGFRIFQFFFIKHQARPTKGRLTPLCVPLDSTKKKVSTRSDSSRKTISRVSTSKLTGEMSCNKRYPFLPDLYHGCNSFGNVGGLQVWLISTTRPSITITNWYGSFHNSITLIPDTGGSTAASVRTKT